MVVLECRNTVALAFRVTARCPETVARGAMLRHAYATTPHASPPCAPILQVTMLRNFVVHSANLLRGDAVGTTPRRILEMWTTVPEQSDLLQQLHLCLGSSKVTLSAQASLTGTERTARVRPKTAGATRSPCVAAHVETRPSAVRPASARLATASVGASSQAAGAPRCEGEYVVAPSAALTYLDTSTRALSSRARHLKLAPSGRATIGTQAGDAEEITLFDCVLKAAPEPTAPTHLARGHGEVTEIGGETSLNRGDGEAAATENGETFIVHDDADTTDNATDETFIVHATQAPSSLAGDAVLTQSEGVLSEHEDEPRIPYFADTPLECKVTASMFSYG